MSMEYDEYGYEHANEKPTYDNKRWSEIRRKLYKDIWTMFRIGMYPSEVCLAYLNDKQISKFIFEIWEKDYCGSRIFLEGESVL